MDFLQPHDLAEALALKAERPDAVPIAGGTDLMVELNFDRRRPPALLDLTAITELGRHERVDDRVRIGALVSYRTLIDELAPELPGLAIASRTVGSPQIRNRGTLAGNLATASPAGDSLPVLLACDAQVIAASAERGERRIPAREFVVAPKRSALEADELITAIDVPVARGPQQFSKIGTRNAMVIAVASFALSLDPGAEQPVGTGIGSAGPTPLRAIEAEQYLAEHLASTDAWDGRPVLDDAIVSRFGELVAAAARPIDDVRGTARYRRHTLEVLGRRTLGWAWNDYRKDGA